MPDASTASPPAGTNGHANGHASAGTGVRHVALAGNPNVGKTTVFNLLTGMRQKVGNYPGVTVERKSGRLAGQNGSKNGNAPGIEVVDLPGTYSLNPKSLDERVAYDMLVGRMEGETAPDVVVCVVDATNLERNLYLASQLLDLGLPVVVALNMMDQAEENGIEIDAERLSEELGVPVVPLVARDGTGADALRAAILDPPGEAAPARRWPLRDAVKRAVETLSSTLAEEAPDVPARQRWFEALGALTSDALLEAWTERAPAFHAAVLEKRGELDERRVPYQHAETTGRYKWITTLAGEATTRAGDGSERTLSDRLDAVLTHRVAGPLIFGAILLLIFQAVFTWAVPAMDLIEAGVGLLSEGTRAVMPDGLVEDMLVDGVITGVGNVVVFLPQILLLFFFLGLMEDTGYMARTSFMMDRFMRKMGLSGGSVIPLISSYACAIPGIMAARTLDDERDRVITVMVAPLMTCSARLPVYTLFIAAFIPTGSLVGGLIGYQGLALFSLYLLGTVMAFVAAWVLKTFVFGGDSSTFMMELPPYRVPQAKQVWNRMYGRVRLFAVRAGKIILGASILLWVLVSFPQVEPTAEQQAERQGAEARYAATVDSVAAARGVTPEQVTRSGDLSPAVLDAKARRDARLATVADATASRQARQSIIGRVSRFIEPVMQPLGFDWKITAGIMSAIAAREVIISALATIYSTGSEGTTVLREALKTDTYPNGELVFTPLVAVSLMVFFVFALQCMSTLAIAKRELNSWLWPAVMWLYMFALAYGFSLVIYQGGQALGFGA